MINPDSIEEKMYVFIDTDVFINAVTGNSSKQILNSIINNLESSKIFLILPEVIKAEIFNEFDTWQTNLFSKVAENLTTKSILGIQDEVVDNNSKKPQVNPKNKLLNAETVEDLIKINREDLITKIKSFYDSVRQQIMNIFQHPNTHIISLTDEVILNGMKRALLKKSPYTHKTTESAHTKDADCIAFESLVMFFQSEKNLNKTKLIMCVKDKDYLSESNKLHSDITESLEEIGEIFLFSELPIFLKDQLGDETINISSKDNVINEVEPSLAAPIDKLLPDINSSII